MCGRASGWAKMAFLCLVVGMTLHIAGWATINWMSYETSGSVLTVDIGLWRQKDCNSGSCTESAVNSQYETDMFNAVRAMETITFCVIIFATMMSGVYVFIESARRRTVAGVLMFLCFLAGTASCIGMIIWLVYIPSPFVVSFSLGLTVIAFILALIAGTLMIPDVFEPYEPYQRSRSNLITPYTPPERHTMTTPISYRGGGKSGMRW